MAIVGWLRDCCAGLHALVKVLVEGRVSQSSDRGNNCAAHLNEHCSQNALKKCDQLLLLFIAQNNLLYKFYMYHFFMK